MVTEVTDIEFAQKLESGSKLVVKLHAEWCGACLLLEPDFLLLSQNDEFSGIEFLSIDSEFNPMARKSSGIYNLPFFAVYRDKRLVQSACTKDPAEIEKLIRTLL